MSFFKGITLDLAPMTPTDIASEIVDEIGEIVVAVLVIIAIVAVSVILIKKASKKEDK